MLSLYIRVQRLYLSTKALTVVFSFPFVEVFSCHVFHDRMSVPANSFRTSTSRAFFHPPTQTPLLLVKPPLNARHASVAHVVCDLVEEDVCAVDGAVVAAHAFVLDGCLDGRAGGGVV